MKKIVFLLVLLLSFSLFASGNKAETNTVTIWWSNSSGSSSEAFLDIVDTFNSTVGKEKDITINAVYQGKASDTLLKVKASLGTSDTPDIAMMDATAAVEMNDSEKLITLSALDTSSLLPSAISSFTSERGLIALPFNTSALLFFYNKTLYDELNLEPPKTLDELAYCVKKTGERLGYGFSGVPTTFELTTFIGAQNNLSYIVDHRNGHLGRAEKVLFGEEGTYKEFLDKWKNVYDTGYMETITSGTTDSFISGRSASILASSSNLPFILENTDDFEVDVAPVPMVNGDATGGTVVSGGALYVFSDRECVKEVLEYLVSPSVQAKWAMKTGYTPVNIKSYEEEDYKKFLKENPLYKVSIDALLSSNPELCNVWLPSAYSIYYAFQKNIFDVLNGTMTSEEGVKEMEKIINKALLSYKEQNL